MEADFSGWATKFGLKCSDGRTIHKSAFEHMDKQQVPLLWQHGHNKPENVLGHVKLEALDEGVYAYAFFNNTPQGQSAKESVQHGDIKFMSIWANELQERAKQVFHGMIREVSLVISGANPGATIEQIRIAHGDGDYTELEEEARITTGLELEIKHASVVVEDEKVVEEVKPAEDENVVEETTVEDVIVQHADATVDNETVDDVLDTFNEKQKNVLYYMLGVALESGTAEHLDNDEGNLTHQEGADGMSRNVFDQTDANTQGAKKHELSHDALAGIFKAADNMGSLKKAVEAYASEHLEHGITDIDLLFPDAKMATGTIELEKRRTEWVASVLNGTRKTPFSRIKTFTADLTQEDARAKGYIKGNYKLEEWITVTKRTTGPTTIYKKQKLDRDDLLDITEFDMVSFLKGEMRLMTEEEFARAVLIGDGRSPGAEDKVKDPLGAADGVGIRSIINDHELFVTTLNVNVDDANSSYEEVVDSVMDGMEFYKGTGSPTFYTTVPHLNKFLKARDLNGRRYYANKQEVADALGVKDIVLVEPMKEVANLIGIVVNLDDYNVGTDRGGEMTMFEDFDIDYNQQKYLLETRASGALVRPKAALVIMKTAAANVLVEPVKPSFVKSTGVVTIPTVTGVVYKNGAGTTLSAGAQTALAAGASTTVYATPASGYYFSDNADDSWPFTRDAA